MDVVTGDAFRDTWRPKLDVDVTDVVEADGEASSPIIETPFVRPLDGLFPERFLPRNILRGMVFRQPNSRTGEVDVRQGVLNRF